MRLIDADELLKKLPTEEIVSRITVAYMPTVDPVKHGWWIGEDDEATTSNGYCSVCGWESLLYETDVFGMPYCPNCGAKMEEVRE